MEQEKSSFTIRRNRSMTDAEKSFMGVNLAEVRNKIDSEKDDLKAYNKRCKDAIKAMEVGAMEIAQELANGTRIKDITVTIEVDAHGRRFYQDVETGEFIDFVEELPVDGNVDGGDEPTIIEGQKQLPAQTGLFDSAEVVQEVTDNDNQPGEENKEEGVSL